ncbi:hypothetical protein GCM10009839_87930 [Catenulispora yoronensis]|uniref:Uncharacterized protein n=1 Tax=Catenulispora yoronensis TaxID=450799 RepID=A0ABN2VIY2_9ACTN
MSSAEPPAPPASDGDSAGTATGTGAGTRAGKGTEGWDWFGGAGSGERTGAPDGFAEPADADTDAAGGPVRQAEPIALSAQSADSTASAEATDPGSPTAAPPPADPNPRARFRVLTGGRSAPSAAESQSSITPDDDPDTDSDQSADALPPADFRVRCPDCGPQFVAVADVRFVSTGRGADTDRYVFTCPACRVRVRRPAGPELARILKTSGVTTLALRRGPDQAL